jgi:hypothetical protein
MARWPWFWAAAAQTMAVLTGNNEFYAFSLTRKWGWRQQRGPGPVAATPLGRRKRRPVDVHSNVRRVGSSIGRDRKET